LASAELYNPTAGTFAYTTGSLNTARNSFTATLLPGGKVLVAGGADTSGAIVASAELYDPTSETFTYTTGSLHAARALQTATLLNNGMVLMAGGDGGPNVTTFEIIGSAELYNPSTGKFTTTGSLNTALWYHTATLLNNGMVLIAGGGESSDDLGNPTSVTAGGELY
jgi:hypothetical protein